MTDARHNQPRLEDLEQIAIGEIAGLPAEHLALLQDEATAALEAAKRRKEWLESAIGLRFAEQAEAIRRSAGKDTGAVRFADGDVTVVADLPKRVEWDQGILAGIVERIRASNRDPADYVETIIKVPERRYAAWPKDIRQEFEPARTVRTGKPTFTLTRNTGRAA